MEYAAMFRSLFPGFLTSESIKNLPPEEIFEEQTLDLKTFDPEVFSVPCPDNVTFGLYAGDLAALKKAVALVDEDWPQYFTENSKVYCAYANGTIVSFCTIGEFGTFEGLRVGGPGCVGTIPAYRKKGIGLKMVLNATAILKNEGYDISYIHYTGVGHWYARLGYKTVVRWNCRGVVGE